MSSELRSCQISTDMSRSASVFWMERGLGCFAECHVTFGLVALYVLVMDNVMCAVPDRNVSDEVRPGPGVF